MRRTVPAFLAAAVIGAVLFMFSNVPVRANDGSGGCDFITGGGFVFTNTLSKANFGIHGGCKHESFWGHLNYVDHGGFNGTTPYHVQSTEITGYFIEALNARTICGIARTNAGETDLRFRVRIQDNEELGLPDLFEVQLSNGYIITTRPLTGGNVQLHKAH